MAEPGGVQAPAIRAQGWTGRVAGATAGVAVAVANLSAVLANVDQIRLFLWERLGLLGLENLHLTAVMVVGALVVYFAVSAVIYFLLVRGRKRIAIAYWALVALMSPAIGYITFSELGPSRTPAMIDEQILRLNQTTRSQFSPLTQSTGAFRFSLAQTTENPQGWTSAQALAAVLSTPGDLSDRDARMARLTLAYLEQVRTPDGWGYQDGDPVGVTEIDAWAIISEAMSFNPRFAHKIWGENRAAGLSRVQHHLAMLAARQNVDGGWGPLGRSDNQSHARTYSTVMALMAFLQAAHQPDIANDERWAYDSVIARGVRWLLLHVQTSTDGAEGWYPNPSLPRQTGECLGLTAQAIYVLQLAQDSLGGPSGDPAFVEARHAFLTQALEGVPRVTGALSAADRDFHFNCRVHDTDIYLPGVPGFRLEPSTFLWFPWSLAAVSAMADDQSLTPAERNMTRTLELLLAQRMGEATDSAHDDQALYVVAETLYAAHVNVASRH